MCRGLCEVVDSLASPSIFFFFLVEGLGKLLCVSGDNSPPFLVGRVLSKSQDFECLASYLGQGQGLLAGCEGMRAVRMGANVARLVHALRKIPAPHY